MLNPWMNNYSGNFGISPDSAASPSHATAQRRDSLNSDPRLIGYGLQQIRNPQNFLYNGITSPGPVQGISVLFVNMGHYGSNMVDNKTGDGSFLVEIFENVSKLSNDLIWVNLGPI